MDIRKHQAKTPTKRGSLSERKSTTKNLKDERFPPLIVRLKQDISASDVRVIMEKILDLDGVLYVEGDSVERLASPKF